jgi:hypothetical protein
MTALKLQKRVEIGFQNCAILKSDMTFREETCLVTVTMERRQNKIKMRIEKVTRRPGKHKKRRTKSVNRGRGWVEQRHFGRKTNELECDGKHRDKQLMQKARRQ